MALSTTTRLRNEIPANSAALDFGYIQRCYASLASRSQLNQVELRNANVIQTAASCALRNATQADGSNRHSRHYCPLLLTASSLQLHCWQQAARGQLMDLTATSDAHTQFRRCFYRLSFVCFLFNSRASAGEKMRGGEEQRTNFAQANSIERLLPHCALVVDATLLMSLLSLLTLVVAVCAPMRRWLCDVHGA